jgi:hypothetical protein
MHLSLPIGTEILDVHEQHGEICMWTLGDLKAETEVRYFTTFGTGLTLADHMKYIGTAYLDDAQLVMHVFEKVIK